MIPFKISRSLKGSLSLNIKCIESKFKLYSDCKEYQIEHNRMICQLDSILRLNLDKFKYIIICVSQS